MGRSWRVSSAFSFAALALLLLPVAGSAATGADQLGNHSSASKVLIQENGKTVIVGRTSTRECGACDPVKEGDVSVVVTRLNADGSLNESYGGGGVRLVGRSDVLDADLAVDGKLVIYAAEYTGEAGHYTNRIYRLTTGGDLDQTFGDGGVVVPDLPAPSNQYGPPPSQQLFSTPDGGMIVSGPDWVRKLDESGAIDPGYFNGELVRPTQLSTLPRPADIHFQSIDVDAEGQLFIGFNYSMEPAPNPDPNDDFPRHRGGIGILKRTLSGQPETSFGDSDGAVFLNDWDSADNIVPYETSVQWNIDDVTARDDGSVVAFGSRFAFVSIYAQPQDVFAIADESRATYLAQDYGIGRQGFEAFDHRTAPGAKILTALQFEPYRGVDDVEPMDRMAVARQVPAVSPDPSFGGDGVATRKVGAYSVASSVTPSAGSTVTAAGFANPALCAYNDERPCSSVIAVTRFKDSGKPDFDFGNDGVVTIPALKCVGVRIVGIDPGSCQKGSLARPRVNARFAGRKFSRSKLVVKIRPAKKRSRPWTSLSVTLPRPLSLGRGQKAQVKAFVRQGAKKVRLPQRSIALILQKGGGRKLKFSRTSLQRNDGVTIQIRRRAFHHLKPKYRGRRFRVKAAYSRHQNPLRIGIGRVRIPR